MQKLDLYFTLFFVLRKSSRFLGTCWKSKGSDTKGKNYSIKNLLFKFIIIYVEMKHSQLYALCV